MKKVHGRGTVRVVITHEITHEIDIRVVAVGPVLIVKRKGTVVVVVVGSVVDNRCHSIGTAASHWYFGFVVVLITGDVNNHNLVPLDRTLGQCTI